MEKWLYGYFPKTRKARVVLAVFIVGGVVGISFFLITRRQDTASDALVDAENPERALVVADTDNDGLKDWEETIYGTDPEIPDTDQDGTNDGEEIKTDRDPLIPGPNDSLRKDADTAKRGSALLQKIQSGESLTRALLGEVVQTQGIGSFVNSANANLTATQLLSYMDELKDDFPPFSETSISDEALIFANDSSPEALRHYFNEVARLHEQYIFPVTTDDDEVLRDALVQEDSQLLQQLSLPIDALKKTSKKLRVLAAPEPTATIHKREIWLLERASEQLELLQHANVGDPLYILLITNMRQDFKKEFADFHRNEIPTWIKEHGITFGPQDAARLIYPLP